MNWLAFHALYGGEQQTVSINLNEVKYVTVGVTDSVYYFYLSADKSVTVGKEESGATYTVDENTHTEILTFLNKHHVFDVL